jgi:molybdopterin molybdotransferase
MRSVTEHLELVLSDAVASAPLEVSLLGTVGCVLAQDVEVDDDGETRQTLLTRGTVVAPRHVALMAAAGMAQALVHPKPRVVIVTVGDDLGEPGEGDLRPDVNGLSLTAAAVAVGAMAYRVGPLPSDIDAVSTSLEDQLVRADIIVAACGMSARDYDLLTTVLTGMGDVDFVRVGMQPGSAQGFGYIGPDRTPIFVLPANPVGTLLSFELYVRPLIRRLAGRVAIHHRTMQLPTATALDSVVGETRYIRAVVEARAGTLTAVSVEGNDEHPLAGLGTSDAVIVLGPDQGPVSAGELVTVMRTDDEADG